MSEIQKRTRPGGNRGVDYKSTGGSKANTSKRLPRYWRERLPSPAKYWRSRIAELGEENANGWASGLCPFHQDHDPSFAVEMQGRGRFRCHSTDCGRSGDVISFHQKVTGLGFVDAVFDLLRGSP